MDLSYVSFRAEIVTVRGAHSVNRARFRRLLIDDVYVKSRMLSRALPPCRRWLTSCVRDSNKRGREHTYRAHESAFK